MAVRVRVPLAALLLSLFLFSCGSKSGYFKLEGRFLHMNQGDFFVYSPDGVIQGVDTIHVMGGRFAYEIPCRQEGTLMIVFPNFSEQPVFVEPGATVNIKADASHMKEMTIEGTDANEDMNSFRNMILNSAPPEIMKDAELFIRDHVESPVCPYLLRTYFITSLKPDIPKALELANLLPKSAQTNSLIAQLKTMRDNGVGKKLPTFTATDIHGNKITSSSLVPRTSHLAIIYAWSSWSYQSQDMGRQLDRKRKQGADINIIGISVDGTKAEVENIMKRDSITYTTICDEQMFESPLVRSLGIFSVPANIVVGRDGRIVARDLHTKELLEMVSATK